MGNVSKVFMSGNELSYLLAIPKGMYLALGYEEGDRFEWQVIQGGFKILKVKNNAEV